jgi:hypothetical protein
MTIETTREAFRAALGEVVKGNENFVYPKRGDGESSPSCVYVYGGKPDCLIAQTLSLMGVPTEELVKWDSRISNSAAPLLRDLGFDEDTALAARHAQNAQDLGASWGHALAEFDRARF